MRVAYDSVVVAKREFAFTELDVPTDAMEQFLERLQCSTIYDKP
ncbi:MAG TPA: hypothetical protein VI565_09855 [Burkholderiales bacterium]|nr:hypothetical protein [Burkholderiales bacterium]